MEFIPEMFKELSFVWENISKKIAIRSKKIWFLKNTNTLTPKMKCLGFFPFQCKTCSEPKQITSSAICDNPNVIKPIPVKPSDSQQHRGLQPSQVWVLLPHVAPLQGSHELLPQ